MNVKNYNLLFLFIQIILLSFNFSYSNLVKTLNKKTNTLFQSLNKLNSEVHEVENEKQFDESIKSNCTIRLLADLTLTKTKTLILKSISIELNGNSIIFKSVSSGFNLTNSYLKIIANNEKPEKQMNLTGPYYYFFNITDSSYLEIDAKENIIPMQIADIYSNHLFTAKNNSTIKITGNININCHEYVMYLNSSKAYIEGMNYDNKKIKINSTYYNLDQGFLIEDKSFLSINGNVEVITYLSTIYVDNSEVVFNSDKDLNSYIVLYGKDEENSTIKALNNSIITINGNVKVNSEYHGIYINESILTVDSILLNININHKEEKNADGLILCNSKAFLTGNVHVSNISKGINFIFSNVSINGKNQGFIVNIDGNEGMIIHKSNIIVDGKFEIYSNLIPITSNNSTILINNSSTENVDFIIGKDNNLYGLLLENNSLFEINGNAKINGIKYSVLLNSSIMKINGNLFIGNSHSEYGILTYSSVIEINNFIEVQGRIQAIALINDDSLITFNTMKNKFIGNSSNGNTNMISFLNKNKAKLFINNKTEEKLCKIKTMCIYNYKDESRYPIFVDKEDYCGKDKELKSIIGEGKEALDEYYQNKTIILEVFNKGENNEGNITYVCTECFDKIDFHRKKSKSLSKTIIIVISSICSILVVLLILFLFCFRCGKCEGEKEINDVNENIGNLGFVTSEVQQ